MQRSVLLFVTLGFVMIGLADCATVPAPETGHGAAVAACAAAVAAHVGKSVAGVEAAWTGISADGVGVVTVTDAAGGAGERRHTCEIDAAGQVRTIRHPRA